MGVAFSDRWTVWGEAVNLYKIEITYTTSPVSKVQLK